jgi:hypothetical protein
MYRKCNNKNTIVSYTLCIVLIIIVVSIICVFANNNNEETINKSSVYNISKNDFINQTEKQYDKNTKLNNTLCQMITQIPVKYSNKIVTICMYYKQIRIDIREFYSNVASIKGVWFLINEWKEFCRIMFEINKAVNFQQFYLNM